MRIILLKGGPLADTAVEYKDTFDGRYRAPYSTMEPHENGSYTITELEDIYEPTDDHSVFRHSKVVILQEHKYITY